MKRLTHEEILKRLKETHGDSVEVNLNSLHYVKTECWIEANDKDYGPFKIRLASLLRGSGHRSRGREKAKKTCLELYGVDNVAKVENYKNSLSKEEVNSRLERDGRACRLTGEYQPGNVVLEFHDKDFGTFFNSASKVMREGQDHPKRGHLKRANTCTDKYGGVSPAHSSEVRNKMKSTLMDRYGVEHALQNPMLALKAAKAHKHTSILKHWLTGEELVCEASYEKSVANYLNKVKANFQWKPAAVWLPKMKRVYLPDLLLDGRYIEIKGFMREHSMKKWEEFKELHPTAELWNKEVLTQKGILTGNERIITSRPVYILSGSPGAGKSFLASQLSDRFEVIDQDKLRPWISSVKQYCEVSCDMPLLIVCTFQVAKLCKNIDRYKLFVILEDEAVYKRNLINRSGKYNENTVRRRHKRLQMIAQKYSGFTGTQQEVKNKLIN